MARGRAAPAGPDAEAAPLSGAWLRERLGALIGPLRGQALCLAHSGGIDSLALLAALSACRRAAGFRLRALHVNHHLQSSANALARSASAQARVLRVPLQVLQVQVAARRGQSLEAAARTARYGALAAALRPGEVLLSAHHQDDQCETVLLQLIRGAGLAGLSAMPARMALGDSVLLRPLLGVTRATLEAYLATRALVAREDPSNRDLRFDRNFLRHQILPALTGRWPAVAQTVARSASHLAEARLLLERTARAQLERCLDGAGLGVCALRRLDAPERHQVIRLWLEGRGLPMPDTARLHELAGPVLAARADALPIVRWAGAEVHRYGGRLIGFAPRPHTPLVARQWRWARARRCPLADGSALCWQPDPLGALDLDALPALLRVDFRHAAEHADPQRGGVRLKGLLQSRRIAPWLRAQVPLLYAGERLIAVADLWLDASIRARPGAARRGRLVWDRQDD